VHGQGAAAAVGESSLMIVMDHGRFWRGGRIGTRLLAIGLLCLATAACNDPVTLGGPFPASAPPPYNPLPTGQTPLDVKYFPSDEPVRLGRQRFQEGNFGLAQRYFQDAVEKAPRDPSAWLGLAASYDRLGRFDLADKSYQSAIKLVGPTTQILNNQGYSYMLRGNLKVARAKFKEALRRDPYNPTIINNLRLLDSSYKYISRDGE
jgi:tetratricopeptide (TPR) repeat protein